VSADIGEEHMNDVCGNCGAKIKEGGFGMNQRIGPAFLPIINLAADTPRSDACEKCSVHTLSSGKARLDKGITAAQSALRKAVDAIPILTIHSPAGWSYTPIGIVTAQSTLGTGLFSDVASTFSDMFGRQSNAYNQKVQQGEELCASVLRLKAARSGGNAILAVDIDYSEMGGQKSLVMVCMTGTAVRVDESLLEWDGKSAYRQSIALSLAGLDDLQKLKNLVS
jgi:uncharacterized protein YbjQ (UPF0145 family)